MCVGGGGGGTLSRGTPFDPGGHPEHSGRMRWVAAGEG